MSHDRYFLDNMADRIFELDGMGHAVQYEGGYTDYLEAKKRRGGEDAGGSGSGNGSGSGSGREKAAGGTKDWKKNSPQKLKFSYKEQREYETIDVDIAALEEKLESIERQIDANATNSVKLKELMEEQERTNALLEEKMERWVYLNDLAEKIAEQE